MKIITETSVLISASVYWENKGLNILVKHPFFNDFDTLLD